MTLVTKILGGDSEHRQSRKLSKKAAILAETMKESQQILDVAGRQAEELLSNIEILSKDIESQLQRTLLDATEQVAGQTRHSMNNIVKQHNLLLKKLVSSLEQQSSKYLQQAQQELARQITVAMEEARADIASKKNEVEKSLEAYEQEKRGEIAKKVSELLPAVIRNAAGHSIPLLEHEHIIAEALKKAEKEIDW